MKENEHNWDDHVRTVLGDALVLETVTSGGDTTSRAPALDVSQDLIETLLARQKPTKADYVRSLRDMGLSESYIRHVEKDWRP